MELLTPDQILETFPNNEYQDILWISSNSWRQIVIDLARKIHILEEQLNKKSKSKSATRGQIILLMEKMSMLSGLIDKPMTIENKAKILSQIIGLSPDNIERTLSNINNKNSALRIESNYKYVINWLYEIGLKDEAKKTEFEWEEIKRKQEVKVQSKHK